MKTITLEEFRAQLDRYLAETADDDVVLTRDGKPWIVLRAVGNGLEADSDLFAHSPEFWQMIHQRRQEEGIPWEEARGLLDLDE